MATKRPVATKIVVLYRLCTIDNKQKKQLFGTKCGHKKTMKRPVDTIFAKTTKRGIIVTTIVIP